MTESDRSSKIPIHEFVGIKQFNLFHTLKHPQFTGELVFGSPQREEWTFYLYLGRIVYATGGNHPVRRWLRNVKKIAPNLIDNLSVIETKLLLNEHFQKHWEYELLTYWLNNGIVSRQYFSQIIRNIIIEILFDVTQRMEIVFQLSENQSLSNPLIFINPEQVIREASEIWEQWNNANLTDFSPNYCPIVVNLDRLEQSTSEKSYLIMCQLFNGRYTIRDLAIMLNQDIVSITTAILPHIERGWIKLISLDDLPCPIQFPD